MAADAANAPADAVAEMEEPWTDEEPDEPPDHPSTDPVTSEQVNGFSDGRVSEELIEYQRRVTSDGGQLCETHGLRILNLPNRAPGCRRCVVGKGKVRVGYQDDWAAEL